MKPMVGKLVSLKPVLLFTAKNVHDPEDYGVKMSVRQFDGGFELCRHKVKTNSHIRVIQALFETALEAQRWAIQAYSSGDKFDV